MFQKSLLILAIAAAASAPALAQSTPGKKEAVARILKVQQPGIENMARALVQDSVVPLMDAAGGALQQRVAADKREALGKEMQAEARKYVDDTSTMVRDRAVKLAPTTVGPLLEEKFSEEELKQLATLLESPVLAKFNALGNDIQRTMVEKLVAETRPQVEPKLRALEDSFAKKLGVPPPNAAAAPAKPAAPKK
ncbi:MAG TPA: hypothetical protein VF522_11935 [Ramlibacter sp.]|uniref:hypothetical protein n=1 Tax=Ramlibacter sp. TaxID=1917967 RepID=UPI002ED6BE0D